MGRHQTAGCLNAAILASQAQDKESKLALLLKMLLWLQAIFLIFFKKKFAILHTSEPNEASVQAKNKEIMKSPNCSCLV